MRASVPTPTRRAAALPAAGGSRLSLTWLLILFAVAGSACGALIGEVPAAGGFEGTALLQALSTGLWFTPTSALTALGIRCALDRHLRGRIRLDGTVILSTVLAGLGGFLAFFCGQWIYGEVKFDAEAVLRQEAFRTVMWGLAGGLMGAVAGPEIPNFGFLRGIAAGVLGGALGCGGFILVNAIGGGETSARLLGCCLFGAAFGAAMAAAEAARVTARLAVWAPGLVRRSVALGATPVTIGSGRQNTIVVPTLPQRAFSFRIANGAVAMTDTNARQTSQIGHGWTCNVQGVSLAVIGSAGRRRPAVTVTAATGASKPPARASAGRPPVPRRR